MKQAKKLFANIFNIAAVAGFILAFATMVGIFFGSYKLVDKLSEHGKGAVNSPTANEWALLAFTQKLPSLNLVDPIEREMSKSAVPPLCNIICNQSRFDFRDAAGEARENPVLYLREFYNQQGPRAFSDPKFRLALETTKVYTNLFSPATRRAIFELGQAADHLNQMSETEKMMLSAKIPLVVFKVGTRVATRLGNLQDRANKASGLNALRQSCSRSNPKEIVRECESL